MDILTMGNGYKRNQNQSYNRKWRLKKPKRKNKGKDIIKVEIKNRKNLTFFYF